MKNNSDIKIFQIGFNKCGTLSFYELFYNFCRKELECIHWDYGNLAYSIDNNIKNNIPALNEYQHIHFFGDMECFVVENNKIRIINSFKYFHILDKQYPNSKFILNTRSFDKWIKSRLNHEVEYLLLENREIQHLDKKRPYPDIYMEAYNLYSIEELINLWKNQWNIHHKNIMTYFQNRKDDLLIFDIEKDHFKKVSDFFGKCDIRFTKTRLPHENKTKV